ncbi:MAG: cbb3-type cytochrome c oxidase subunit I, partial [Bacteroidales bacterium]|nr:cbb3-type cytochrome c oxidase subunit I [Bacteroidales bacterium]
MTSTAMSLNYLQAKKGIFSWIFSLDHKRIALLYLYSILTFFIAGATLGVLMRLELLNPGRDIMEAQTYNQVFTMHGVIMIFLFIIPSIPAIFGNFFLPIMLGTDDVSFPRLNLLSWWIYIIGAIMALSTLLWGDGPADTGWTFYAPYSVKTGTNVTMSVLAAFVLGFATILTGLNFIVTIHRLRTPGMTFLKMPLFAWALYATS